MSKGSGDDDRRVCASCGATAPATDTAFTLISAQHGWRVTFEKGPSGRRVSKWRCPECWEKYKDHP